MVLNISYTIYCHALLGPFCPYNNVIFFHAVVVSFEQPSYTFNESAAMGEVCVVVIDPPPLEELVFRVMLQASSRDITARNY